MHSGYVLRALSGDFRGASFSIHSGTVIGRDAAADLILDDPEVSRLHASVALLDAGCCVRDLGSANGTFVDGQRLQPREAVLLREGQRVGFGPIEFALERETRPLPAERPSHVSLADHTLVGRDPRCDVVLPFPDVSREHCAVERIGEEYVLTDLDSTNGTFVNGLPCTEAVLRDEDAIQIGLAKMIFRRGRLHLRDEHQQVRLDVRCLTQALRRGAGRQTLLRDVSFTVYPNELVAIVGGSGAGKSTLLKALNGMRPASDGEVLLNGTSLYHHAELFRSAIGYVPQDDILHRELTVHSVLSYSARLRLPPDTSAEEVEGLIDSVLRELGLSHRSGALVSTLSGGERKRVNIAVELLTRPGLLFLDEPTSGLDPGLERRVVNLLRRLAEEGRTIVFVTHATESISQCDLILFLARGGKVAFYGPPAAALEFFGASDFSEAYLKVNAYAEDEENPWVERFRQSGYYREYVARRQQDLPEPREVPAYPVREGAARFPRANTSALSQFLTLSRRYADVIRGDLRNLLILLGQAPVLGLILALIFKAEVFTTQAAAAAGESPPIQDAPKLLFMLAISALWFGTVNAARELSKERAIFLRERLINLRVLPYLLSKVAVLSALCLVQSGILLGVVRAGIDFHVEPPAFGLMWATLFLASLCATLMGLAISSAASSNDQAMSLVPLALLPQVVFSGLLIPLDDLGPLRPLSVFMPSRWAFGALANLTELSGRYREAGVGRFVLDAFQTLPGDGWLALGAIGLLGFAAAWTVLACRDSR